MKELYTSPVSEVKEFPVVEIMTLSPGDPDDSGIHNVDKED